MKLFLECLQRLINDAWEKIKILRIPAFFFKKKLQCFLQKFFLVLRPRNSSPEVYPGDFPGIISEDPTEIPTEMKYFCMNFSRIFACKIHSAILKKCPSLWFTYYLLLFIWQVSHNDFCATKACNAESFLCYVCYLVQGLFFGITFRFSPVASYGIRQGIFWKLC